jgi:putative NADH-flavin reductase
VRILFLGVTGTVGRPIAFELHRRGHEVVSGLRPGSDAIVPPTAATVEIDPTDPLSVAAAALGVEAVISAIGGGRHGNPGLVRDAAPALLEGLEKAGVKRLLVVGGAGSLIDRDGRRRVDAADFPADWRAGSLAQADALARFRSYDGPVDWTYLSPSDQISAGVGGDGYELGDDHLLRGADGDSWVSLSDYAKAMVDELEGPAHSRRRFTVRSREPQIL